jgi:hypothetical protein
MFKFSELEEIIIGELDFKCRKIKGRYPVNYTIFMDFMSYDFRNYYKKHRKELVMLLNEGYINIKLIPLVWVKKYFKDYLYSMHAANACAAIKKKQPEILLDFVDTLLVYGISEKGAHSFDFGKDTGRFLAAIAREVGARSDIINYISSLKDLDNFGNFLAGQSYELKDKKLINKVPTFYVNERVWNMKGGLPIRDLSKKRKTINDL